MSDLCPRERSFLQSNPFLLSFFIAGSDNDAEDGVVGNLNKFVVVPPGYTDQPKKGHLIFDASFESGKYHLPYRFHDFSVCSKSITLSCAICIIYSSSVWYSQ